MIHPLYGPLRVLIFAHLSDIPQKKRMKDTKPMTAPVPTRLLLPVFVL